NCPRLYCLVASAKRSRAALSFSSSVCAPQAPEGTRSKSARQKQSRSAFEWIDDAVTRKLLSHPLGWRLRHGLNGSPGAARERRPRFGGGRSLDGVGQGALRGRNERILGKRRRSNGRSSGQRLRSRRGR